MAILLLGKKFYYYYDNYGNYYDYLYAEAKSVMYLICSYESVKLYHKWPVGCLNKLSYNNIQCIQIHRKSVWILEHWILALVAVSFLIPPFSMSCFHLIDLGTHCILPTLTLSLLSTLPSFLPPSAYYP